MQVRQMTRIAPVEIQEQRGPGSRAQLPYGKSRLFLGRTIGKVTPCVAQIVFIGEVVP